MSILAMLDEFVQVRRATRAVVTSTIRDVKTTTAEVAGMAQVKARVETLAENVEFNDLGQVSKPLFRVYLEPGLTIRTGDFLMRLADTSQVLRVMSIVPIRNRRGDSHQEATAELVLT